MSDVKRFFLRFIALNTLLVIWTQFVFTYASSKQLLLGSPEIHVCWVLSAITGQLLGICGFQISRYFVLLAPFLVWMDSQWISNSHLSVILLAVPGVVIGNWIGFFFRKSHSRFLLLVCSEGLGVFLGLLGARLVFPLHFIWGFLGFWVCILILLLPKKFWVGVGLMATLALGFVHPVRELRSQVRYLGGPELHLEWSLLRSQTRNLKEEALSSFVLREWWTPVGLISVLESEHSVWGGRPDAQKGRYRHLYLNGSLSSSLNLTDEFNLDIHSALGGEKIYRFLPNVQKVLLLGSGLGQDLRTLRQNPKIELSSVDVIPGIGSKSLFQDPQRHFEMDGRAFLNSRKDQKFDVIDMTALLSRSSFAGSARIFESSLFSLEAFASIHDRLNEEGLWVMDVYHDSQSLVLSRILRTLDRHLKDHELDWRNVVIFIEGPQWSDWSEFAVSLYVFKRPLTQNLMEAVLRQSSTIAETLGRGVDMLTFDSRGLCVGSQVSCGLVSKEKARNITFLSDWSPYKSQDMAPWHLRYIGFVFLPIIGLLGLRASNLSSLSFRKISSMMSGALYASLFFFFLERFHYHFTNTADAYFFLMLVYSVVLAVCLLLSDWIKIFFGLIAVVLISFIYSPVLGTWGIVAGVFSVHTKWLYRLEPIARQKEIFGANLLSFASVYCVTLVLATQQNLVWVLTLSLTILISWGLLFWCMTSQRSN